ncbi:alpha/beta fold hydrolase [Streptomyces sp. SHP 1-2]|uniref:alpha/beta fold hydrolase n=1 Tax=Streptomyces sp. SHP 1-2 TaxID=2769489 RepID=UPI002237D888|nr:alpha/beta fold hydrolase [Streptomyces sp. SHP 1-2]MCW5251298.1 alpha/beta fold hydrolase [Streptomyces sp. SHP 1-2]
MPDTDPRPLPADGPAAAAGPWPVTERRVRAGGYTTRYLEAGAPAAPVLLLLHDGAWGGSSDVTWGAMIPMFAQHYRVLAPDLLGFGGTDKVAYFDRPPHEFRIRHLAAFLRVLAVEEPVHVIGNSFGGTVALRSLPEAALPTRSVVSIAGGGGPWRTPLSRQLSRWDGSRADIERILRLLVDDFPGFAEQAADRTRWARQPGHFRAMASIGVALPEPLKQPRQDAWPAALAATDVPLLLVKGTSDSLLEPGWAAHIAAVAPRCEVVELPCRHAPNIDMPHVLLPVLLGFLRRIDRAAAR